jgi:hypothetical protein
MLDVGDAGNLGGGVLQQARDGGRFIDNSRERRERALIVQSFLWIEHWSASYRRSTCGLMQSSRFVGPLGRRCREANDASQPPLVALPILAPYASLACQFMSASPPKADLRLARGAKGALRWATRL